MLKTLVSRLTATLAASILLALVLGNGCTPPPPPEDDIIIPQTTKVLDTDSLAALVSVGTDGAMTFSTPTPLLIALAPGDVIVAGVSSVTPYGLLRKVQSSSTENGQVLVQTTQAKLEEAITKAHITFNTKLTSNDIAVSEPHLKGISRRAQATEDEGVVFGLNDVEIYSDDNAKVTISGTLAIKPSLDFDLDLSLGGIDKLTFGFGAGGGITLDLKSTGQADFSREVPVLTLTFAPFIFPVGPVPVIFTPKLTLFVGADGHASAAMSVHVAQQAEFSVGLGYDDGSFDTFSNSSSSFDFDIPTLTAQASARAYGGSRLSVLLYGVIGPYADARGYLQADVSLPDPSCVEWQLKAGLEANVGADFLVAKYETQVFDESKILDQSEGCEVPPQSAGPWARSYGGTGFLGQAYTVRATSDGGFIYVGNGGFTDIAKLDANGNVEWHKTYSGTGYGVDLYPEADGYIVGSGTGVQGIAYVTKLDFAGNILWSRRFETGDQRGIGVHSIRPVPSGGYIVTGPLMNLFTNVGAWVARLDSNGNVLWSKRYAGTGEEQSNTVRPIDGGFLVAGSTDKSFGNTDSDFWLLTLNNDGGIEKQRRYDVPKSVPQGSDIFAGEHAYDLALSSDGYYVVGRTYTYPVGWPNVGNAHETALVVRLNAAGDVVWGVNCDPESNSLASGVVVTDDGLVAGGRVNTGLFQYGDAWVFRLDSAGNLSWSKTYGSAKDEGVGDLLTTLEPGDPIQATLDGGFIFAGGSNSFNESQFAQHWLVKVTKTGTVDFAASSGAQTSNLAGTFTTANVVASDTSAAATDLPLTVTDVTGNAQGVASELPFVQQAP